jgi:hypothetical protein
MSGLAACQPTPTTPPSDSDSGAEPDPVASTSEPNPDAPVADPDCVSFVEKSVVEQRYATALVKLEESRDGEHYRTGPFEEAMGALAFAADNGHLEAQSLYGRTMFGVMFTSDAPQPDQRDEYVAALAFLRVAAKAGEDQAAGYLPGLTDATPPTSEPPLDSLPAGWVQEAYQRADLWIACHGLPKRTGDQ